MLEEISTYGWFGPTHNLKAVATYGWFLDEVELGLFRDFDGLFDGGIWF